MSQSRHSRTRSLSSARSVARTLPASAALRRWREATGATLSGAPPGSKPAYSGPSARSLSRRRRRVVHLCCTARGRTRGPCAGRPSQRKTSRRGPWAAWTRATWQVRGPPCRAATWGRGAPLEAASLCPCRGGGVEGPAGGCSRNQQKVRLCQGIVDSMQQSSCCSSKLAQNALSSFMHWMVVDQLKIKAKLIEKCNSALRQRSSKNKRHTA